MGSVEGSPSRMYQQHWGVLGGSGLDVAPAFGSPFTCFVAVLTVNLVPLSEIYYPVLPGSLGKAEGTRASL